MAVADPDLDQFRHDLAAIIGSPVTDVGMLPDANHLAGGGYHCGAGDLIRIGRFHMPRTSFIGASTEDYSVRQQRDRAAVDDRAAAVDEPDDWPNGGREAWIRANNLVVAQMQAGDPALAALRAVNFTPDGTLQRRYDSLHPEAGVIASTDTVRWHTHYEFWRDTLGTAALRRALARLLVIVKAAIAGRPVPPEEEDEDDMGASLGPMIIWDDEPTSLCIPPVAAGLADPRDAWLNVGNDTFGAPYALRIWRGDGAGNWAPLGQTGLYLLKSGVTLSVALPAGTRILSITRKAVKTTKATTAGQPDVLTVVDPDEQNKIYAAPLTCCIERGPVKHA